MPSNRLLNTSLIVVAVLLVTACAQKEEEKIIITLKTEGEIRAAPTPPAARPVKPASRPAPTPIPVPTTPVAQEPPAPAPAPTAGPPQAAPRAQPLPPPEAPAPPEPVQEARLVPTPEETQRIADEALIRAMVQRQETAFDTKDVGLYMQDLAVNTPKTRKGIQSLFNGYKTLSVGFTIEEVQVEGKIARVTMLQTTRLEPKGLFKKTQRSKTRVLWDLGKVNGAWKIRDSTLLEKLS